MTARGLIVFVVASALVGSLLVSPVAASNNQGLYWGISVGQRFDYTISRLSVVYSITQTSQERFYVIVDSLPEIQDDVMTINDLPYPPDHSAYYENGTMMGPSAYLWYAQPVGNWNLIIHLWPIPPEQEDPIDTPLLVGLNFTYETDGFMCVYSEIYRRSTGVLYEFLSVIADAGDTSNFYDRTEVSLIEGNESGYWTIVAVGGAVVVGVLLVVAVIVKRGQS